MRSVVHNQYIRPAEVPRNWSKCLLCRPAERARDNERRAIKARSVPNYPVRRDHGCRKTSSGRAPEIGKKSSFGGRRLDILRIGFESPPEAKDAHRKRALEQQAVLVLPENLMTRPAVADGRLGQHGLPTEIGQGGLLL